jgi:hypothetical protein
VKISSLPLCHRNPSAQSANSTSAAASFLASPGGDRAAVSVLDHDLADVHGGAVHADRHLVDTDQFGRRERLVHAVIVVSDIEARFTLPDELGPVLHAADSPAPAEGR